MRVNVLTPVRRGGPYNWGAGLTEHINTAGHGQAAHLHSLSEVLSAPVWQDADVVHTALPLTARLWRKPVVLTVHGEYSVEAKVWRLLYPAAVRLSDEVTTPSTFLKERLGLDRAEVIPNAVFPGRFKVLERSQDQGARLVTVTKFYFEDKARGVLDLLQILEQAQKCTDQKISLTVAGGGRYLEQVRQRTETTTVDVRFTGFLDRPWETLGHGELFVYYSTHDNFPITLLEAMASGLPVLTNDVGAVREIITPGREGYVARSDGEYADYLCRLLESPELRLEMGRRARRTVEEKFSWAAVAGKYVDLYRRVLE